MRYMTRFTIYIQKVLFPRLFLQIECVLHWYPLDISLSGQLHGDG
jgi:hypothetical protein